MNTKETTDMLKAAFKDVQPQLNAKLFQAFQVLNPLELAQLLNHLDLSDAVRARILLLKVSLPPKLEERDIDRLIEQSMTGAENPNGESHA